MSRPFEREHADAWSSDFVDVESLNAAVSDRLLKAIDRLRETSRRSPGSLRSETALILGPAGSGKTHLFGRLRRRAGPRATFVLLRPELGGDPTPRSVLAACMDALQQRVAGREERQLDLVVGSALAMLEGHGVKWPGVFLEQLRMADAEARAEMLAQAVEHVGDVFPDADLAWLERFLAIPVSTMAERRAAMVWLSGREPDATQLARLGLQAMMPESSTLPALRTLAFVASYSTPITLVFDQLENLVEDDDPSGRRIHAHARLVSELSDTVRGLVIAQMALDGEWLRRIGPRLGASERSRLEARVEMLELPTESQRAALVESWVDALPPEERRPMPWPFTAAEWAKWKSAPGVTPRMLMIACREASARADALAAPVDPAAGARPDEPREDRLFEQWTELKARAQRELHDADEGGRPVDKERIVSALVAVLRLLGVPAELGRGRLPHDLRLRTSAEVDVFVVQHGHHRSAGTSLLRATEAARERRVVALRELARPFPPSWTKVHEQLAALRGEPAARFVELAPAELGDLLATHDLLSAARSQDLSNELGAPIPEERVLAWARDELDPGQSPLFLALLAPGSPEVESIPEIPPAPELAPPRRPPAAPPADHDTVETPRLVERPAPRARPPRGPRAPARPPTGSASAALAELGLASVDRVLREVRARDPGASRATVVAELRVRGDAVRWFGSALVAWRGGAS